MRGPIFRCSLESEDDNGRRTGRAKFVLLRICPKGGIGSVKGSSTSTGLAGWISSGVILDRSTLADWLGCATFLLRPGHERPLAVQKRSADGSGAPVLDPGGIGRDRPVFPQTMISEQRGHHRPG
jgi:hypothetical protein